jgi:predicted transcriptional regulator
MDFKTVKRYANILSKPFAEDILKILVNYQDISASETATRLNLHIKTAQDFLEELTVLDIAERRVVSEKKRPYYRYKLKKYEFAVDVDLSQLVDSKSIADKQLYLKIREARNTDAVFSVARSGDYISSVTLFVGEGRQKKQRKISFTRIQGKFLYHLPFPTAPVQSIYDIMQQAGVDKQHLSEILDIVDHLIQLGIIDTEN